MTDLLEKARRGDMDAFARLFEPLRGKVYAVGYRIVGPDEADDVVMDTYLRAWRALPGFDGRSSLKTWLLRIAANRARDLLRSRHVAEDRRVVAADPDAPAAEPVDPTQPGPDERVAERDNARVVDHGLAQLPEIHRTALLLRYADGLSYSEIAAATRVSIGTVMSRLFNAKRKLRAILEQEGATA